MNLTAGGRQRICVPDNYQKLVQQPLSTIQIPLFHMFDKFSTRPSTIEMRLSFDSFIYAQVRSAKHDRANLCHHRSGHQGYSKGERHLEEWTLLVQRLCPIFWTPFKTTEGAGFSFSKCLLEQFRFLSPPLSQGASKR